MSHSVVSVTDATFNARVLEADRPVLVKFEAPWCGPCKAMAPMIDELAAEFGDRLTIATLDIDQNNRTPHRFGVRGVPTVMIFDQGQVVAQKIGLPRKPELAALILQRVMQSDYAHLPGHSR